MSAVRARKAEVAAQALTEELTRKRAAQSPERDPAAADHLCIDCKRPCDCGDPRDCYWCRACWGDA